MSTTNTPAAQEQKQLSPVDRLKNVMSSDSVQQQFKNALAENSSLFVASVIDLFASDTYLQKCNPNLVVMECLKAATLKLPINKSLGFAYVVPYQKSVKVGNEWKKEQIPQFQIGYRGLIQLAMRSGIYKIINADVVYEGELWGFSKLTGEIDLSGKKASDTVIGYFAYIEATNGFKKSLYMSKEQMEDHGKRYSKAYDNEKTPWRTNFDGMGVKTVLRLLLGKYGLLSVEMAHGMASEDDETSPKEQLSRDLLEQANQGEIIDMETGEITRSDPAPEDQQEAPPVDDDPGY